ncbi:A-kinase anchor protein 17B [Echinops telfairi]|uniref:A-kinase anchor protein 17B n=1 Tax=Echinops telfairi TaxID=9371 RepID=A0ABM0ZS90_ECHTE|nr:A-kinase anchor protein 17B [Echinops telfairi]
MTVTVVYDNSEATELCAAQHLYLKPIAKLMINVLLPESPDPVRPFSNWEVLDQLKSLICPDQFTTVRLSKSTKDFIRFEGEAETRSLVQILKAKLHGKIIKLNGLKTDLKVVATDAQGEWEHFPKAKQTSMSDGTDKQDQDKSLDSIYFEGLPCKWFAPKGSSGEKPCKEILRAVFESFGKIKNVDIPMLDPYREVMTGGSFGNLNFGLQTFEAFIQYQESTDFVKAMESLRGMKLMLKGDDGKALACNIKVMFDTTKHFSEGAIRRRNQERLKLQELEEERKREKKREEEEAERKRKDEERRRKTRVRRRGLKERDRHRRKRHKDKVKTEVPQQPDSLEEWIERKYLLAQRRVEALRLLRMLLRKIAGSTSFNPEMAAMAGPEAKKDRASGDTLATLKGEELNPQYRPYQEERPKYQLAKSDTQRKHKTKKRTGTHLRKSSHHLRKRTSRHSARKERARKLLSDEYDHSLISDQNPLQMSKIQDQSFKKDDCQSPAEFYASEYCERDCGRRQIYETDGFINYLLNYYHTPKYARDFLEPHHLTSTYQWQRTVQPKENGFQINLTKCSHFVTSLSPIPNLEDTPEDDYWKRICTPVPDHKPQAGETMNYAKECSKGFKKHLKDSASESDDQLSLTDRQSPLCEETYEDPTSADLDLEWKDALEEISSDSECFHETLSCASREEQENSVAACSSSPEKEPFDSDETTTCDQETRSGQENLHSKYKQDGEKKHSQDKLRKPSKRFQYELRCSRLEGEEDAIKNDRSYSKKREKLGPKHLSDTGYYHKTSSTDLLEDVARKRRRLNGTTFNQPLNFRPSHVPIASSQSSFHLREFSPRREPPWESKYNQSERRLQRYENSDNFMLNSDDYYIRHNYQEDSGYGRYLGNNSPSSLYFQMF